MSNHLKSHFNKMAKDGSTPGRLDPRLVAMVRLMARRAAEKDFMARLLSGASPLELSDDKDGPK